MVPWHCDACRQIRYNQRKEKAAAEVSVASPAAIVVSQAPAVADPALAAPSIGVPLAQPSTQSTQASNVSEESWNEIVEFGDSEEFFFMISDSNALHDIAGEYGSSSDDDSKVQTADNHSLRFCLKKGFNVWAALVIKKCCSVQVATVWWTMSKTSIALFAR